MAASRVFSLLSLSGVFCFLLLTLAHAQDTSGYENNVSKQHEHHSQHHVALSRLEQNVNHQMREMERRLLHKLHTKLNRLNMTSEIRTVENLFNFQFEEFSLFRENDRLQQKEIVSLRSQVAQQNERLSSQQKDISALKASLADVVAVTRDLHEKLDAVMMTSRPGMGSTVPPPTEMSPINPRPHARKYPADCEDVYLQGGLKYPGVYYILIQPDTSPASFKVSCKVTDNAGWTVIQRREDGSVDFFRDWADYKEGFGELEGEFWLGLDHIYQLTNQADYRLRVEMKTFSGEQYWAEYDHFRIADESDAYRLHVHGYHGDAGDALTYQWSSHDGQPFSTRDQDHDARHFDNCARDFHGAWWFRSCFEAHLNGRYFQEGSHKNYFQRTGVLWNTVHDHASLKTVSMMIRPNPDVRHDDDVKEGAADVTRKLKRGSNRVE